MGKKIVHAGFVSKITNIAPEDALSIQILKKAGAVIHVRTNQPQSLMVCQHPKALCRDMGSYTDIL